MMMEIERGGSPPSGGDEGKRVEKSPSGIDRDVNAGPASAASDQQHGPADAQKPNSVVKTTPTAHLAGDVDPQHLPALIARLTLEHGDEQFHRR